MQKYSTDQYNKIFYSLPKEIQDIVVAYSTTEKLYEIGQTHKLHIDQIGVMNDVAFDVMMGITSTKNMVAELAKELQIPELEASKIAFDVDEQIFKPIKEIMKKVYGDGSPMRPKPSYQYVHEEDEKDIETHTSRANLLKEIEAPEEAQVKKIIINPLPEVKQEPAQEKNVEKAVKSEEEKLIMDETLKQKREKLLQSIADKKLSSMTVMKAEEETLSVAPPRFIPASPVVSKEIPSLSPKISEKKEEKPKRKIIDPFLNQIQQNKVTEDVVEKENKPPTIEETSQKQEKIIDPYREPIE